MGDQDISIQYRQVLGFASSSPGVEQIQLRALPFSSGVSGPGVTNELHSRQAVISELWVSTA